MSLARPHGFFNSSSIRVKTPDGVMYVHIMEDEHGEPFKIMVSAGKCGTSFSAWADATCHLISELLATKVRNIAQIIQLLSEFHTDKSVTDSLNNHVIRSGVHGLKHALLTHMNDKAIAARKTWSQNGPKFGLSLRIDK